MAVKLRLRREGGKKDPRYRIVAADSRSPRDGRFIEIVGHYQPTADPSVIEVDEERVRYWLGVGAQPTQPVGNLLRVAGVWERLEAGEPPGGGPARTAAPSQVTGGGDAPAEQAAAAPEEVAAAAGPSGGTPEDATAAPIAETQPTSAPEGAPGEGVAAGAAAPEQTPTGTGEEDA